MLYTFTGDKEKAPPIPSVRFNDIFGKLTNLFSHHYKSVLDYFCHPNKIAYVHLLLNCNRLSPSLQATSNLISVSIDWPFLDISCKLNHTVHGLCVWLLLLSVMLYFRVLAVSVLHSYLLPSNIAN